MDSGGAADIEVLPGHLLRRCQQIAVGIFLDECRALDLTPLQYAVLQTLAKLGPVDQVRLGGHAALDRTTVTVVVGKLAERGLLARSPSPKDRRAKIVAITEAGSALLARAVPHVLAAQARMTAPFTEEERGAFLALLQKFAAANNSLSRAPMAAPPAVSDDAGQVQKAGQ